MSSILETFYILFESDASGVTKGTQEAKQSTDKLNQSLKTTETLSTKVGAAFGNIIREFGGFLLASVSAGAIFSGVKAAAEYADNLDKASKALNVNIEVLDAWGGAVERSGGTAQGFQQTLKSLVTNDDFQALGRRLTGARGRITDVISVLPRLADLFERLGKTKAGLLGQKLGLDQGTIALLQQGRREVDTVIARQKELGLVTKADAEIARKFNEQWIDTGHAFRSLFTVIGGMILPIITELGKLFERTALFFRRHSNLIVGGLIAIGTAVAIFVVPPLLAAAFAASRLIILVTILTAIGTAFSLVYDDLMAFYAGHKSVIGFLINKWPIVGEILKAVENIVKGLGQVFKQVGTDILNTWTNIADGIQAVIDIVTIAIDKISSAYKAVKAFLGFGDTDVNITAGQRALNAVSNSPLAAQTSNSLLSSNSATNKSTTVNTGPITVQTQATDADGIASAIGVSLNTQMRQATNTFDDGVAA